MKPIVGVMPLWDIEKNSLWMLPKYLDGVTLAGGIPFVFPFIQGESEADDLKRLAAMCDGFLFTGGPDVSPALYGEEVLNESVICVERRDRMEQIVLQEAMAAQKPILGVCRGVQFINVMMGGTLYQDIPTQHPSDVNHRQDPPFDAPAHQVEIVKDSPLWECLFGPGAGLGDRMLAVNSMRHQAEGRLAVNSMHHQDEGRLAVNSMRYQDEGRLAVNSMHHQAVKEVAPKLEVMAISEDGLVEALCMPDYPFLWAVQWHPEVVVWNDENSRKIFRAFVDAM